MSSGNPFRASQLYTRDGASPVPPPSLVNPDSSVKKQVRIVSPAISIPRHPEDDGVYGAFRQEPRVDRLYHDPYVGSPPPLATIDSTSTSSLQGDSSAPSTWGGRNMAATGILPVSVAYMGRRRSILSPSGAPANPFSQTLASLEPHTQGTASADGRTKAEKTTPGSSKAALDVESFKNLLLTGKATPRTSAQSSQTIVAPNTLSAPQFESGSSTDASSISRQSLYEPPQEILQETPRTSYEMPESEEDEIMGLVSEVRKGKKKPPPAPKHRHGKLVTPRQPQVVSFESFTATDPAPAPTTRSRDNSDVNKPLPPTPVVSPQQQQQPTSTQDSTSSQAPSVPRKLSDPPPTAESLTVQKRVPPPVPLSRRQSQLRTPTSTNLSRSNSPLTITSQHSIDQAPSPAPSIHDPMSSTKAPPPPPPSRHGARLTKIITSSGSSSSTEVPRRSVSTRTAPPIHLGSPSRRSTLDFDSEPSSPTTNVNRTLLLSNRPAPRTVSGESIASLPPPPPPPRRRQSNRSSLDQQRPLPCTSSPADSRRTSTEYRRTSLDSGKRRTSVASESSLRREYAPVDEKTGAGPGPMGNEHALYSPIEESENTLDTGVGMETRARTVERTESGNILDDMDKFQREIDELRNRYAQAR